VSLVLASDYQVKGFAEWWAAVADVRPLARFSAHHLVVYRGIEDEDRVFVTVGIRDRRPLERLFTSPDVLAWFDQTGVEDIPPIFVGEVVEKLELQASPGEFHGTTPVIVAGIVRIPHFDKFWGKVHSEVERLRASGVTRYWAYRALDDPQEVMFLQEVTTEKQARRWIRHRDAAAEWMSQAGVSLYPAPFIGRLVETIEVPAPTPAG
jgi:hypothetical protein